MFYIFTLSQCHAVRDITPDTKSGNPGRTPKKNLLVPVLQHLTAYWTFHCEALAHQPVSLYYPPTARILVSAALLGGVNMNLDSWRGNFVFAATQNARSVVSMREDGGVCFFLVFCKNTTPKTQKWCNLWELSFWSTINAIWWISWLSFLVQLSFY